jgi:hypothetical protein
MANTAPEENPRKKIRLDESAGDAQGKEKSAESEADREMRLGITSYTNRAISGFSGTLKQRYTDFLVNEILLSGEVLHLENIADSETPVEPTVNRPPSNLEPPGATAFTEKKIEAHGLPIEV